MDSFDREKLAEHNGRDGKKTYVAYDGRVYDLSDSKRWKNGKHMMRHEAGADLTVELKAAPHGPEVFEKFQPIGEFREEVEERAYPWPLGWVYAKFPIVKRHAHPVAVHFPIAFFMGGFLFVLLYLILKNPAFEQTAFFLAVLGTVTAPFSVLTGFQSWWLYYDLKRTGPILFKIFGALVLIIIGAVLSVWHFLQPQVLTGGGATTVAFVALYAVTPVLVMTMGYFGGSMSFPD